jgi:DNA-binding transcriptional ArsR family regulator
VSRQRTADTSLLFNALVDPTRRSLVAYLAEHSPRTATELARTYPMTRQGIHKHLTLLRSAGLVEWEQQGRDKRYSLTPRPLSQLVRWANEISAVWDARLLRLKALVEGQTDDTEE